MVESPALGGQRFGEVGQYERLRGTAYGAVDPGDRRHLGIVNLASAPRNAEGQVEYRTTVEIYRPRDMRRWNRAIYHTVPNRGGAGAGEPALLERGFALVRVGWQGDIAPADDNIVASLPVAKNPDGSPIVGPALEEFIFDDDAPASRVWLTYPAASRDASRATLTVTPDRTQTATPLDDSVWSYLHPRAIEITRPSGFDGGAIYQFVYQAKDPIVMGLGFAAMRDVVAFLRYDETDQRGTPNPLAFEGLPAVALSLGISQSGRFLRDFLYQGFNEDVSGRIVFDGIHPDIAGSRKTFTNYAFSQPGRWQKQHEDHAYPGDQFPFTYTTLTDPISGRTDGLLDRCAASDTCPKIVHTDGEAELWQARASLIVTDPEGQHIELPDNVRVYLLAGTQHGGGRGVQAAPTSRGICQHPRNPLPIRDVRLALTLALYEWVVDGVEPPDSRFPTVASGGLVPAADLAFPDIPGVTYTGRYNPLHLGDYGTVPPTWGPAYAVLVGRVDADGNMIDGVRHPTLAAPIGTHTGWNLRRAGFAAGAQCGGSGSFLPFVPDRVARQDSGDPRRSIQERYPTDAAYVRAVSAAADRLVADRLLLAEDAARIINDARRARPVEGGGALSAGAR